MRRPIEIVVAAAAVFGLAAGGISQLGNPSSSAAGESVVVAHDQSRGDEQRDSDMNRESNEDEYDSSEFQGDNESSNTNDETVADVDAANIPDEN
ncbi:MAG: hypothetical protein AB1679_03520 [Actinomycetota bacterium]|jgi:hypothetical protein